MDNQSKQPNQANQPPEVQTPKSSKLRWVIVSVVVLVAAIVLVLVFQQGGYLQARVSLDNRSEEEASVDVVSPPDDYTAWEGGCVVGEEEDCEVYSADSEIERYCTGITNVHIADCGYRIPGEDYVCRTQEADEVYSRCLEETTQEDLDNNRLFDENLADIYADIFSE